MRILENFNRPEITALFPAVEIRQFQIGDVIPQSEKEKIGNAYNVIAAVIGDNRFPVIPVMDGKRRWFTYLQLNLIEGIVAYILDMQSKIAKYGTNNYYGSKIYGGGFFG